MDEVMWTGFFSELEEMAKEAAAEDRYSVVPKTYTGGQWGMDRAFHMGTDEERRAVGKRALKGALMGGVLGALAGGGLGALKGRGHILPGILGGGGPNMVLGGLLGSHRAVKENLESKGIKTTWGGLGRGRFTPEAAANYLKEGKTAGIRLPEYDPELFGVSKEAGALRKGLVGLGMLGALGAGKMLPKATAAVAKAPIVRAASTGVAGGMTAQAKRLMDMGVLPR